MIIKHNFINVLDKNEIDEVIFRIDSIKDFWEKRSVNKSIYFYTIGAASYIDDPDRYKELCEKTNEVLYKNFKTLYEKIINVLKINIGDCQYVEELNLPTFQIFGEKISDNSLFSKIGLASHIHRDEQVLAHKTFFSQFKDVDEKNVLSFILPLEVQGQGSLIVWNEDLDHLDLNTEYSNRIKKMNNGKQNPLNYKYLKENINNKINVIEHVPGRLLYIIGDPYHSIGFGIDENNKNRRITLQGHGVKCDGIWRLFF